MDHKKERIAAAEVYLNKAINTITGGTNIMNIGLIHIALSILKENNIQLNDINIPEKTNTNTNANTNAYILDTVHL